MQSSKKICAHFSSTVNQEFLNKPVAFCCIKSIHTETPPHTHCSGNYCHVTEDLRRPHRVSSVVCIAFYQLQLIHKLQLFLDKGDLGMVIHSVITFRLKYSNMLDMGLPLITVWKFHLIQNAVVELLLDLAPQYKTPALPIYSFLCTIQRDGS